MSKNPEVKVRRGEYEARTRERHERRESGKNSFQIYFKCADLGAALRNCRVEAGRISEVVDRWIQFRDGSLVEYVEQVDGEDVINLGKLSEVAELSELANILDNDLTLRGLSSSSVREYVEHRHEVERKSLEVLKEQILLPQFDLRYGLVDEIGQGELSGNPEVREAYFDVQRVLQEVLEKLFSTTALRGFKPVSKLTRSAEKNAFVLNIDKSLIEKKRFGESGSTGESVELPVFVHVGLFEGLKSLDELAGILAHEFAHLLQPAVDKADSTTRKRLEFDADAEAMVLADAAGYNPRAIIDFFKTISDRGSDAMSVIFGGTHPPTADRIKELERTFHRTDLPFPNGAKPYTRLSEETKQALLSIEKERIVQQKKQDPALEVEMVEKLLYDHEVSDRRDWQGYSSKDFIHQFSNSCASEICREWSNQELVHGKSGVRDVMLRGILEFFTKNFSLGDECFSPEGKYKVSELEKVDLGVSWNHKKWAGKRVQLSALEKHSFGGAQAVLHNWIEDESKNVYIKKFWDFIRVHHNEGRDLTKDEKAAVLAYYLPYARSGYARVATAIVATEEIMIPVTQTQLISKTKDDYKKKTKKSLLSGILPVKWRSARRDSEVEDTSPDVSPKPTIYRAETRNVLENLSFSFNRSNLLPQNVDLWTGDLNSLPLCIRDAVALYQNKVVEETKMHISEKTTVNISGEAVLGVLRILNYNGSFGILDNFEMAKISVSKLFEIYEILKIRKLPGDLSRQEFYISVIERLIVFGLNPQNEQEEGIVNHLREILELKSGINRDNGGEGFTLMYGLIEDIKKIPRNETYTEIRGGEKDKNGVEMGRLEYKKKGVDKSLLALYERCWMIKGAGVMSKIKDNGVIDKKGNINAEALHAIVEDYTNWIYEDGILANQIIGHVVNSGFKALQPLVAELSILLKPYYRNKGWDTEREEEKIKWKIIRALEYDREINLLHRMRKTEVFCEGGQGIFNFHHVKVLPFLPKDKKFEKLFSYFDTPTINESDFLEYLEGPRSSAEEKDLASYYRELKSRPGMLIPTNLRLLGMGFLIPFSKMMNFEFDRRAVELSPGHVSCGEIIKFVRMAEKIYGNKWQGLEQYKRFDEQLSNWEWNNENKICQYSEKKKTKTMLGERQDDFMVVFVSDYGAFLEKIYRIDNDGVSQIYFSWPMLLQDIMNDEVPLEKMRQIIEEARRYSSREINEDVIMAGFMSDIKKIKEDINSFVADKSNLDKIKGMQRGFFREFLLEKIYAESTDDSLETIEEQMVDYRSTAHEMVSGNQVATVNEELCNEKAKMVMWEALVDAFLEHQSNFVSVLINNEGEIIYQFKEAHSFFVSGTNTPKVEVVLYESRISRDRANESYGQKLSAHDINQLFDHSPKTQVLNSDGSLISERYDSVEELPQSLKIDGRVISLKDILKPVFEKYDQIIKSKIKRKGIRSEQIPEHNIYVFSDKVTDSTGGASEFGPAYRYRRVTQPLMDWHVAELRNASNIKSIGGLDARVVRDLPEKNAVRDLFMANQMNAEVFHLLLSELGEEQCQKLNITLRESAIDLQNIFPDDQSMIAEVYLKKYSIFELSVSLDKIVGQIPKKLAREVVGLIEKYLKEKVSEVEQNKLRRLIMRLEEAYLWPHLRTDVAKNRGDGRKQYLKRILDLYPVASVERDDVLERIGMSLVSLPEDISHLWSLRYDEQIKWPEQNENLELQKQFSAFEKARFAISMMSRVDRLDYLTWIAGGDEPTKYALASHKTNVDIGERKNVFWALSAGERKILLYEVLLGGGGVLQEDVRFGKRLNTKDYPWPVYSREGWGDTDFITFAVEKVFNLAFGSIVVDENLPEDHPDNIRAKDAIKTIFVNLFIGREDASRRAELMVNFVEAIGSAVKSEKEMNAGELIRLMLEQVGVVGIKTGQVLSEQPGLLPEKLRNELAKLKDKAPEFSKRVFLTYLESAGLTSKDKQMVTEICEIVGVASIKEVARGVMADGRNVAVKAKRPSIDKYFADDIVILKHIVSELNKQGYNMPEGLISEIEHSIIEELSFISEAENQRAMQESLAQRSAKIDLKFDNGRVETIALGVSASLETPQVTYPDLDEVIDIGLMVEEFVQGLSFKDIKSYRDAISSGEVITIQNMEKKISEMYGKMAPEVMARIRSLDIDNFQAQIALELVREITSGGVFHADLHSGNFYLNLLPILDAKVTMIDLGSAGYSSAEFFPSGREEKSSAPTENTKNDFKTFITGLVGLEFAPEKCLPRLLEVINVYAGNSESVDKIESILLEKIGMKEKVQKLFYGLLEGRGEMNDQFRYLLKALITAADHLDKLKNQIVREYGTLMSGEIGDEEARKEGYVVVKLAEEGLIDMEMLV